MGATTGIEIRRYRRGDDLAALTDLLHRAYAPLGALGFNYTALDQPEEVTRQRIESGIGLLALAGDAIVGTVALHPPGTLSGGTPWYQRGDVARLGQLAIEPALAGRGLGGRLMGHAEDIARDLGAAEIALDTAEGARHLVRLYERRGYRCIEIAAWPGKTYRSVIMSKVLAEASAAA